MMLAQESSLLGKHLVHQGHLGAVLQLLFPNFNINTNVKKKTAIKSASGKYIELDVWIPEKDLAFEFQDIYHYTTTWYSQIPLSDIQQADDEKKIEIRKRGITLIEIPIWWKGDSDSLLATILFQRPDMNDNINCPFLPIPLNPASEFSSYGKIPEIGELMYASFSSDIDFTKIVSPGNKWWMGEKYDGLRVCWHPIRNTLYSRSGNALFLLDSVKQQFPRQFIDGEAWFGRGGYVKTRSLFTSTVLVHWKYFRILAFDVPMNTLDPFELRYQGLLSIPLIHPFVTLAFRCLCSSAKQLMNATKSILETEGEGIILRKPQSIYEHGRTNNLIKVKAARGDSEAIVMEVNRESVVLKLPEETIFNVPYTNVLLQTPLKKGDVVSFSYTSYSRYSIPKDPQIVRIRSDLTWKEVLHQHSLDNATKVKDRYTFQQKGYWTQQKEDNFRGFFEEYAKSRNIDPLNPASWYNITLTDIKNFKGGRSVLNYVRGGIVKALITAFPDIGLDKHKFDINYNALKDVPSRRKWFLNYAKAKGIHPFVAENWYNTETDKIMSYKGGASVLRYYSLNFATAIIHLFPEVQFDPTKFNILPYGYWKDKNNRRLFFEDIANKMGFDALVTLNWYKITHTHVVSEKRGNQVLAYYGGNFVKALISVFPEIAIDPTKFVLPKSYWMQEDNRRWFFTTLAKKMGFDYKKSEIWYSMSLDNIMSFQGASSVLQFYNGNWIKALTSLFPFIGLDILKFRHYYSSFWQNMENRRWIFEEYARQFSFDALVPENWYPHLPNIYSHKAIQGILNQYNGNIKNALVDIFPQIHFNNFPKIPISYYDDIRNRQSFFKSFAEEKGFDPLVPENWYSIPLHTIRASKGSHVGIKPYGGNIIKALLHLFPKIGLDETKFKHSVSYWKISANRKQLFETFAQKQGFDPYVLDNWSTLTHLSLDGMENASGLSEYYFENQSIASDIADLFRTSRIDPTNMVVAQPRKYWANLENQKAFLEGFAKQQGFDPQDPQAWYYITTTDVSKYHKGKSLIEHYNGSFINALLKNFPDIGLDVAQFSTVPKNYWQTEANRRRFFEMFALENRFDPLQAEQWYSVSKTTLLKKKGGYGVLQHFKRNVAEALVDSFPDIGLDTRKFKNPHNFS